MEIVTDYEAVCWIIDGLLARWRSTPKQYPFNRPDAIIPQTIIPEWLRKDKQIFPNWYLGVDEHMKGRVNSLEAFRGHIRIAEKYPWFYIPRMLLWEKPSRIIEVLEDCISSDKVNVARDWRINALHLETYYDGNAKNLFKGVTNWDEAVRRVKNKRTKGERLKAGFAGEGFYGHQEKMVSMQLYFQDWERWLKKRFAYPAPSDLHNQRIAVSGRGLRILGLISGMIKDREKIAAPWRAAVLRYVIERKEDPIDVADVLWLFSNLMCGNSPLTETSKVEKTNGSGMFDLEELPHGNTVEKFLHPKYRKDLEATCLICPFLKTCDYAVPARPYYDKGLFVLRPRPKVEEYIDLTYLREPTYTPPGVNLILPFDDPA